MGLGAPYSRKTFIEAERERASRRRTRFVWRGGRRASIHFIARARARAPPAVPTPETERLAAVFGSSSTGLYGR